jgi:hypothetical protein
MKKIKILQVINKKENLIFIFCILILLMFIFKSLNIFIFTSRDSLLNRIPFSNYTGFDPFHRFTDWLIFSKMSIIGEYKDMPWFGAIPYGYSLNLINKSLFDLVSLINPVTIYDANRFLVNAQLIFIILSLFILYFLLKTFTKVLGNNKIIYLYFLIFILCNYPIWMLFDRGNADIYTLLLLIFLLYLNLNNNFKHDWLIVVLIVSLKPSNLLLLAPIIFFNLRIILMSIVLLLINYFLPVLLYDHLDFDYMMKLIINNQKLIAQITFYCNNLACGLRSIGIPAGDYKILGIALLYLNLYLIYILSYFLKYKNNSLVFKSIIALNLILALSIKFYTVNAFILGILFNLCIVIFIVYLRFFIKKKIRNKSNIWPILSVGVIVTLMMNDPSPDYRLTLLIPIFLFWVKSLLDIKSTDYSKFYEIILFSIIFGFNSFFFVYNFTIIKIISLNLLLLSLFYKRFEFSFFKNLKTFA